MRPFLLSVAFCLLANAVFSQSADTTHLREITVYGLPLTEYATGSKVETINVDNQLRTLAEGLGGVSSLYLKNYGNQQLSTIALRGTTASQTAVLWNGININSPTLGQTDFSLVPLFFTDEISLHYGTASSLYGSDAIGGSIMIGQKLPDFKKSLGVTMSQQLGSFGKNSTGLKLSYGNERWHFRTKVFRAFIRNNFSYFSPAVGYEKEQAHASVIQYGVDQQLFHKISDDQLFSAEVMYTNNDREIQPAVTNDQGNETLQNKNLRAAFNYTNHLSIGDLHATAGFQFSDQYYFDDITDAVSSTQTTLQVNIDKPLNHRNNFRYGLSYNYYTSKAENFNAPRESRYDVFGSWRYALFNYWVMNLNVRQSVYDQHYAPFTPSVGTEIRLREAAHHKINLRAIASRGFRVPTLDDRYWVPGGNPNTKPEEAYHAEGGINWLHTKNSFSIEMEGTYHQSWINKMIVWNPIDDGNKIVWSPVNLQKVKVHGAELSAQIRGPLQHIFFKAGIDYSYTKSLNQDPEDPDFDNKQLPYVPVHSARASLDLSNQSGWSIVLNYQYTGIRYSALDNADYQVLDDYALADLSVRKKLTFSKWSAEGVVEVKNIGDIYFENLKNRAMPGRNYVLSLFININHKTKTHEKL